jgi:hypothetical protein
MEGGKITPNDLEELLGVMEDEQKLSPGFDVVMIGMDPDSNDLCDYEKVGATWGLEASGPWSRSLDEMKDQIRQGPPCG